VLLALFSRIREDKGQLTRVYQRVTLMVSYVGISVFVGVALTADAVVPVVFGTEWAAAVPAFQLLSIALIPIVLTANLSSSLLYALGKSSSVLIADLAINLPYLVALILVARQGLMSVLYLYLGYCFVKGIALQSMSNRRLSMNGLEHLTIYARATARVAIMAAVVIAINIVFRGTPRVAVHAAVAVVGGAVTIVLATWFTDRDVVRQLKAVFRPGSRAQA
jgi:O-antigen/teichoic acid export membrane protein